MPERLAHIVVDRLLP